MGEPAIKQTDYSEEEYLAIEEQADYKSEYCNGEIFAMSGGSYNHNVICLNLGWGIREATSNKNCTGFIGDMKLNIPVANAFVYPDLMVVCGDVEFFKNRSDVISNPILIIEVLSPSTHIFDRGDKFSWCRSLPSVREYVLISQNEAMIETYFRQDEKTWIHSFAKGLEDKILFRSIRYELALKEVYDKTMF